MRLVLGMALVVGCSAGKVPFHNVGGTGSDSGVVDTGSGVTPGVTVSGHTTDYSTATPLDTAALTTDGIDPALTATSGSDGSYELDNVPIGSKVFVIASRTDYRATRSEPVAVGSGAVMQDLPLVSSAYFGRQYTTLGKAPTTGDGVIIVDLIGSDGTPIDNIVAAGIKLTNGSGSGSDVTVIGPFFIGSVGDVDPTLTVATTFGGASKAILLDVPPGNYTLEVDDVGSGSATDAGVGSAVELTQVSVTAVADGVTLATTLGGAGSGSASGAVDPTFATDIYPRLQRAASGGLGCADCHTGTVVTPIAYDLDAATVLTNMLAATGSGAEGSATPLVDLVTPANSLLLERPLYELPPAAQDHPNATFLDTNDSDYQLFLRWITQGAKP